MREWAAASFAAYPALFGFAIWISGDRAPSPGWFLLLLAVIPLLAGAVIGRRWALFVPFTHAWLVLIWGPWSPGSIGDDWRRHAGLTAAGFGGFIAFEVVLVAAGLGVHRLAMLLRHVDDSPNENMPMG